MIDSKHITSSGISAGTDMTIGLVGEAVRGEQAERIARGAEYVWNDAPHNDPFAVAAD